MSSLIKISPSILSADFSKLGDEIIALEKAGADYIHIDVMDGHFVPNITIGPEVIKRLRPITKLTFDVHLMIAPVDNFVRNFAEAGADIITFHPEATKDLTETIKLIKSFGKKVGVSLKPESPISLITSCLEQIDLILIMSVNPGFGGQSFIQNTYNKVKELKKLIIHHKSACLIEIDGGVTDTNAALLISCGADVLVAGNYVFKAENPEKRIKFLKEI